MPFQDILDYGRFVGHHTLIYGEPDTKKTLCTARFVQYLIEIKSVLPKEISILDFAPPLIIIKNVKVGGKIKDFYEESVKCRNILFDGEIIPPRLNAKSIKEIYENACRNFKKIQTVLKIFNDNPTSILIMNDISIYLHIGSIKSLLKSIYKSTTFFGNSYYGSLIKSDLDSLLSLRERRLVKYLIKKLEKSYFTG